MKAVVGAVLAVLGTWSLFAAVGAVVTNLIALGELNLQPRQRGKTMAAFSALFSLALVCKIVIPSCYRAVSRTPSRDEVLMSEGKKQLAAVQGRLRELDYLHDETLAERSRVAGGTAPVLTAAQTAPEQKVRIEHLSRLDTLLARVQATRAELKADVQLLELSLNTNRLLQKAPNRQDDELRQTVMELTGELRDRQQRRLP